MAEAVEYTLCRLRPDTCSFLGLQNCVFCKGGGPGLLEERKKVAFVDGNQPLGSLEMVGERLRVG